MIGGTDHRESDCYLNAVMEFLDPFSEFLKLSHPSYRHSSKRRMKNCHGLELLFED
jgi:hypothetical protein